MKRNVKNDVFRRADGTVVNSTTNPANGTVVEDKKFSLSATTDKMGITEAGKLTRTFFWGAALATIAVLGVGFYYKKLSINYAK